MNRADYILLGAAVIVRLVVHFATQYTVDDAFITFRYAENLAAGHGFVYNIGERVLGTSTPLFTLVLAAFNVVGIGSQTVALLLSLAASGLTTVLLYRWSCKLGLGKLAVLPAIIYIVFPRSVICDICGMETALVALLFTSSMYFLHNRHNVSASILASLTTLARPEGWALLALVATVVFIRDRDRVVRCAIPAILIAGGWLLFAGVYFGSVVPNSAVAKMALYSNSGMSVLWQNAVMTLGLGSPFGWILWPLLAAGAVSTFHKDRLLTVMLFWCAGYLLVLVASGTHVFFWYPAPVYPVVLLGVVMGIARLLEYVRWHKSVVREYISLVAIAAVVIAVSLVHLTSSFVGLKSEMDGYRNVHVEAGKYLALHAQPKDIVLAEDIGYLGHYYRGNIVDRDGLVTPQAIPYNRAGRYREFADSVNADWIFIDPDYPTARDIIAALEFARNYERVDYVAPSDKPSHQLYRRVASKNQLQDTSRL